MQKSQKMHDRCLMMFLQTQAHWHRGLAISRTGTGRGVGAEVGEDGAELSGAEGAKAVGETEGVMSMGVG